MNRNESKFEVGDYDATKKRYKSKDYAEKYKYEYTEGYSFKSLRSRLVAEREILIIKKYIDGIEPKGDSLIDVPCGTGKLGEMLSRFDLKIISADISLEMINLSIGEYCKQTKYIVLDSVFMPFGEDAIDYIVCLRLFQRLPKAVQEKILKEFYRVCKKGIIFSFSAESKWLNVRSKIRKLYDWDSPDINSIRINEIKKILDRMGFKVNSFKHVLLGVSSEVIVYATKR